MEKYYIPEISEFYDGFEYEILRSHPHDNTKSENLFSIEKYSMRDDNGEICLIFYKNWEKEKLRVKHLDQTDIEELGWGFSKYCYKMVVKDTNHIAELRMLDNNTIHICKNLGTNERDINSVDYDTLFEGTIKNKSELKKLMAQLGI